MNAPQTADTSRRLAHVDRLLYAVGTWLSGHDAAEARAARLARRERHIVALSAHDYGDMSPGVGPFLEDRYPLT